MPQGVAHDVNNFLGSIVGYPDLLLDDIPECSPMRSYILSMQRSGEKAAAIMQDMLTLARRGVIVKEVINLNAIISDYLDSREHYKMKEFHPNVEIETKLEKDLSKHCWFTISFVKSYNESCFKCSRSNA